MELFSAMTSPSDGALASWRFICVLWGDLQHLLGTWSACGGRTCNVKLKLLRQGTWLGNEDMKQCPFGGLADAGGMAEDQDRKSELLLFKFGNDDLL